MSLTLLNAHACTTMYMHVVITCHYSCQHKKLKIKIGVVKGHSVQKFKWTQTDGQMDGGECIASHANNGQLLRDGMNELLTGVDECVDGRWVVRTFGSTT